MTQTTSDVAPVRKSHTVKAEVERAFHDVTAEYDSW